eukprot:3783164-Amphidinium_carterae.1
MIPVLPPRPAPMAAEEETPVIKRQRVSAVLDSLCDSVDAVVLERFLSDEITDEASTGQVVAGLSELGDFLSKDMVQQARAEELHKIEVLFQCFQPIHRKELPTGATVFGHRWVDSMRHGAPKSRLTLKDFRHVAKKQEDRVKIKGEWDSEEITSVQSPAPSGLVNRLLMWLSTHYGHEVIVIDVVSAFPHAEERSDCIFMEPPSEWLEAKGYRAKDREVLWKMTGNLYGRRTAPAYFREHFEGVILAMPGAEFRRGVLEPCMYFSAKLQVRLVHHVDDVRATGPSESLRSFVEYLSRFLLLKVSGSLQVGSKHEYLGRHWCRLVDGWMLYPDHKHSCKVFELLGFGQGRPMPKPALTPG